MEPSYDTLADFIRANPDESAVDLLPRAKRLFPTYSTQNTRKFRKYVSKVRSRDRVKILDLDDINTEEVDVSTATYDIQFQKFGHTMSKTKDFIDILDLCNDLNCTPKTLYRIVDEYKALGNEIIFNNYSLSLSKNIVAEVNRKTTPLSDCKEVVFGVCSDLHFGSNACQLTALNEFAELCKKQDVKHMLVPGDILAGHNVYSGQAMDQYAFGADEQEASAIVNLPAGFDWYLLGGNHDYSFIRHSGHNPITVLASKRDDIHYIGYDEADIPLLSGVDAKLWHPSGGVPYSHCLSEDTEILTRSGWIGCKDISLTHEIATLNQKTGELEYQFPEEMFVENYEGDMIRIHSRTVDHFVTPNHDLWVREFDGKNHKEWKKLSAEEVYKNYRKQKFQMRMNIDKWNGEEKEYIKLPFKNWSGARDLGEISMDLFLSFLGWYISEGHTSNGKVVCLTQKSKNEMEQIKSVMEAIGLNVKVYLEESENKSSSIHRIKGYNSNLVRWLDENCGKGAKNKRVPRFIMDLSSRQIKIFLDSLFMGDGTKSESKEFGFSSYGTISSKLSSDVQELLLKIGYAGTIGSRNHVGLIDQSTPYITNEPEKLHYKGKIWCVKVPNSLIYARRNGKAIWTGNSYRLQKGIERVSSDELSKVASEMKNKPTVRFLFVGHLHIQMQAMFGSVMGVQCGCFEGTTNYLRRKGLVPTIGGWIIKATLNGSGMLKNFDARFHMFEEIQDDWRNYRHTLMEGKLDPIFS